MPKYICTNFGSCPAAGKFIEISPGAELVCPEDGFQLQEVEEARGWIANIVERRVLASTVLGSVLVISLGGWYFSTTAKKQDVASRVVTADSVKPNVASGITPDEKVLAAQKQDAEQRILAGVGASAAATQKSVIANEYIKAAIPLMQAGKWQEADGQLLKAKAENPEEPLVYINQAIVQAKQSRTKDALSLLETAFQKGFRDFAVLDGDSDLNVLRSTDGYKTLVGRYKGK